MRTVYEKPDLLNDCHTHYCPGCGHGIAHRLVSEVLEELGIQGETIGIAPVGCAVLAYDYINVDMIEVAHGRAPAVATGMKRTNPDKIIFSYQGDGDLAAIGTGEIMHAAHRGEQITVIFINNAVFGMTGGQLAPTTMLGQVTATTPKGRQAAEHGYPMKIAEILAMLPRTAYVERCALSSPANIRQAKKAIKKSFQMQVEGVQGLGLVELLSPCPTYWRKSPVEAVKWIESDMTKIYPLGCIKNEPANG